MQVDHPRGRDQGFTLVEILIAIVLVGILSAVVVLGVSNLTSKGSDAACSASLDAARAGSQVYLVSNGSYPTTFTQMTTGASPALSLPSGVAIDASGVALNGSGWILTLGAAGSAPPQFTCFSSVPTGFTVGPNGHLYKFVSTIVTWNAANTAAATNVVGGQTGYLATITSAAEQTFVIGLVGGSRVYLGGSDSAGTGAWRWVGGPEAGTQFWAGAAAGSAVGGSYTNWASGQPDNPGSERCLELYQPFGNKWNDIGCSGAWAGYVVEIGG
jgi:prepilin-type N-terminal cleavage/methylation domain-containing protein